MLALYIKKRELWSFRFDLLEILGVVILIIGITSYLIYPSLSSWLPPSRHFDAVNHMLLARTIFESGQLPHDFTDHVSPYFFSTYPVGGALVDTLLSIWIGSTSLRTLHPLIALISGLSAALLFVLLARILPRVPIYQLIAFVSILLLFTAWDFFAGAVNERYFFAQVFAQFYALILFWWLYEYTLRPSFMIAGFMALALATVVMSHPTPIIAPLIAAYGAIVLIPKQSLKTRFRDLCVVSIGLASVGIFFVLPRLHGWINQTSYGEAAPISFETMGVVLPMFAAIGVPLAISPRWRQTFWLPLAMGAAILAQALALFLWQWLIGKGVDVYYFEKALYLLIYPLALLAALPFAEVARRLRVNLSQKIALGFLGMITLASAVLVWQFYPPRPFAPLTESELQVALWAKQNLDVRDIGFISRIHEDAYWMQLGIFEQSPYAPATTSWYNLGAMTYQEWRADPGWPHYAIVRNLANVPREQGVAVVYQNGASGILRKPAPDSSPPIVHPEGTVNVRFGKTLNLVGYDLPEDVSNSASFTITLYWKPIFWATQRIGLELQLIDSKGKIVQRSTHPFFGDKYPTQRWPVGITQSDPLRIATDSSLAPGKYHLRLEVFNILDSKRLPAQTSSPVQTEDYFTIQEPVRVK